MSPRLLAVAAAFAALAAGLVIYKVAYLGYELTPRPAADRWSVQTKVKLSGAAEKARVAFFLPADGPTQRIYDERASAEGMRFFIRPKEGNRMGVVVGQPAEGGTVSYRFSLQSRPAVPESLPTTTAPLTPLEAEKFAPLLGPDEAIQSDAEPVLRLLEELAIKRDERAQALRQIHEFVVNDLATTDGHDGPQDALAVLDRERGGSQGKARAAVALLRASGIPSRVVVGVPLAEGNDRPLWYWVEAHLEGKWWPLDPVHGQLGTLSEERLVLHIGDSPAIESSGVDRIGYGISMLRERENQAMLHQRRAARSDRLFDKLSLYSLPLQTQLLYRVLLLLPLGALVVVIFRNLVGVPTLGTFMPILISLAFREAGIGMGLLLLAIVVGIGYAGRFLLDRAQLLMVPRLSFLLTLVILIMAGVMVVADHLGSEKAFSIALFPIVIVTMTIERLSVAIVEEGARNAAKLVLGTVVVATCGYLVLASDSLQHFVFTFPEVHLATMAVLLILGRYTGYRLSEWTRFRAFRKGSLERAM